MAKKGQCFAKYSNEMRSKIVEAYLKNEESRTSLSKKYGVPDGTIATWLRKYKREGTTNPNNHFKGRKKEDNLDYKERYEILKKYQAFLKAQRERK